MSPALLRFTEYRRRALDLEWRKGTLRRSTPGMRAVHNHVILIDEQALDRGWEEAGIVAEEYSDDAAELLAAHYLFCEDWHDVAAERSRGYDEVKKKGYRALLWLDARDGVARATLDERL
jgi:hypothetical protein